MTDLGKSTTDGQWDRQAGRGGHSGTNRQTDDGTVGQKEAQWGRGKHSVTEEGTVGQRKEQWDEQAKK